VTFLDFRFGSFADIDILTVFIVTPKPFDITAVIELSLCTSNGETHWVPVPEKFYSLINKLRMAIVLVFYACFKKQRSKFT